MKLPGKYARPWLVLPFFVLLLSGPLRAAELSLSAREVTAGTPLTISGTIDKGEELVVVAASAKLFRATEAPGSEERRQLEERFGPTAIPPIYYVLTSNPEAFATPETTTKGQTDGPFAFAPFKYQVRVNKLKPWDEIRDHLRENMLGPVSAREQWDFLIYSHENRFGINTITKEKRVFPASLP